MTSVPKPPSRGWASSASRLDKSRRSWMRVPTLEAQLLDAALQLRDSPSRMGATAGIATVGRYQAPPRATTPAAFRALAHGATITQAKLTGSVAHT